MNNKVLKRENVEIIMDSKEQPNSLNKKKPNEK